MRVQPAIEIGIGGEFEQCLAERFDAAKVEPADGFFLESSKKSEPAFELPQHQVGLSLLAFKDAFPAPLFAPTVDAEFDERIGQFNNFFASISGITLLISCSNCKASAWLRGWYAEKNPATSC